jgi:hypothetical protein
VTVDQCSDGWSGRKIISREQIISNVVNDLHCAQLCNVPIELSLFLSFLFDLSREGRFEHTMFTGFTAPQSSLSSAVLSNCF